MGEEAELRQAEPFFDQPCLDEFGDLAGSAPDIQAGTMPDSLARIGDQCLSRDLLALPHRSMYIHYLYIHRNEKCLQRPFFRTLAAPRSLHCGGSCPKAALVC